MYMHLQSRSLMLASAIALAGIGGLAASGAASAGPIAITVSRVVTIMPATATTLNVLPNIAPSIALNFAPTTTVSPTFAISPTVTAPVLSGARILPALPGL